MLLLRQLLSKERRNSRFLSVSKKCYSASSCCLTLTRMIFAMKPAHQKTRPGSGNMEKIGYTISILFISLLRMAELIIIPHQSPWTMQIVNAICGIGNIVNKAHKVFESFYRALFTNICLPVMELLFQYIPLMIITMLLYVHTHFYSLGSQ